MTNAIEIIRRSIELHPSLFVDALVSRRAEDHAYAARCETVAGGRAAVASGKAATRAIGFVRNGNAEAFKGDLSAGIIALNIACKLQCLPAHVRTAAAVNTWES